MPRGSDLVFVGDVHLDRDDAELPMFLTYLRDLGRSAGRVVLIGDLFNLWIAEPGLEQDHHRAVLEVLRELRRGGTETHYLEGNRDFRIARTHAGGAFDAVSDRGLDERWAGRRIWASHGDLVNVRDRQYRAWRRISRSPFAWNALALLPARRRFAFAEALERRLRGTNTAMKRETPDELLRAYAAPWVAAGCGTIVLGHFHVERELAVVADGREGRVFVLPLWKEARRHLRLTPDGTMRFEAA